MSMFKVNIIAISPASPERKSVSIEALVDTGSERTWMPKDALAAAGIKPVRKKTFQTATKQIQHLSLPIDSVGIWTGRLWLVIALINGFLRIAQVVHLLRRYG